MNKNTNYWITAIDTACDESWVHLQFETRVNGKIEVTSEEMWERDSDGVFEHDMVVHGERVEAFANLSIDKRQELINMAIDQEDEPILFVA